MLKLGMPAMVEMTTAEDGAKLCRELNLDFLELNINFPQFTLDQLDVAHLKALAKEYGILGMLTTTWNGIPMEIKDLIYGICLMWEPDAEYANKVSWS